MFGKSNQIHFYMICGVVEKYMYVFQMLLASTKSFKKRIIEPNGTLVLTGKV